MTPRDESYIRNQTPEELAADPTDSREISPGYLVASKI